MQTHHTPHEVRSELKPIAEYVDRRAVIRRPPGFTNPYETMLNRGVRQIEELLERAQKEHRPEWIDGIYQIVHHYRVEYDQLPTIQELAGGEKFFDAQAIVECTFARNLLITQMNVTLALFTRGHNPDLAIGRAPTLMREAQGNPGHWLVAQRIMPVDFTELRPAPIYKPAVEETVETPPTPELADVSLRDGDWENPTWPERETPHDWKNHIHATVRAIWPSFTDVQKKVLAYAAQAEADREEWD